MCEVSEWAAIQALAAMLEPEAFDPNVNAVPEWREPTKAVAVNHAAKVITLGYRLVSDDEATVERVARALAEQDQHLWQGPGFELQSCADHQIDWVIASRSHYLARARAAVRALREAGTE